jgi:predicted nuclease of restriction endonuclease-like (RecB) superfamily
MAVLSYHFFIPPKIMPKIRLSTRDVQAPAGFDEVLGLIQSARQRAFQAVNVELIDLYWQVGQTISRKIEAAEWGAGVVDLLAGFIARTQPGLKGFSRQNMFRMRRFYEAYRDQPIVSALLRQLAWTHNLIILSQSKYPEEREFYLRLAAREKWSSRELERQFRTALFERTVLDPPKVSAALARTQPAAATIFKDSYILEFLQLGDDHTEADLHGGLLRQLRNLITEMGRDFCLVGSEYPLQVGNRDFALDLLFFHRGMNCLVAVELKIDRFEPEHLGKLQFYLEALDSDVRKSHENPSIGLLLCASKDSEVVEYALRRSISPALIADYQTFLPDKQLLQTKLREFYQCALVLATEGKKTKRPAASRRPGVLSEIREYD